MTTFDYSQVSCDLCGSSNLIINKEEGSLVCKECGNVVAKNLIDLGREWRIFFGEHEESPARTGAPSKMAIHDKGITTDIRLTGKDKFSGMRYEKAISLTRYQRRIRVSSTEERNLYNAFVYLDEIAAKLNLPDRVKETAAQLYRKYMNECSHKGKSVRGLLSACIYSACKLCDYPMPLKELLGKMDVRSRNFSKYYARIQEVVPKEFNNKIRSNSTLNYVPPLVDRLKLGSEIEITTKNILEKALNSGMIAGKSPLSLAAAAVYIACTLTDNRRTQRQIAEVSGVTEVTIRNRSKELIRSLDISIEL
ncbi:MAG TPA: TFIIB-type zinc ribbon-containing protein [Geobacterales bacterium]|nr:TFIIB-type zinc ribbon-containing protein [Geobacterales bacterium]